jgi:hypothetical protein
MSAFDPKADMPTGLNQANDTDVFGFDAKKDRNGNYIEQGIGSEGHETLNHFANIRKYEGDESYWAAVSKCWRKFPDHAARIRLPKPPRAA